MTVPSTLFHKVWDAHAVRVLPSGQTQLFVGLHLIHEVTSPQAFDMLRQHGWRVAYPERTFATVDHIVPTSAQTRPFIDLTAEEMTTALERNCRQYGIQLWAPGADGAEHQGIVHVIGPELGLTQPGMTIACGDSHTSTHGALGAIAFGIGTSQVRDVLASQCLALDPVKVRRIDVNGQLPPGVYAKDVILTIIRRLGVQGGVGFAYEYGGSTHRSDDDRRAHDDLQHVDRGRRTRRLRQPGRDDVRLPEGPPIRAVRRGVRPRRRVVAADRLRARSRRTTTASRSTPPRSSRPSPGASIPASRSGSASRSPRTPTRKRWRSWGSSAGARMEGTRIDVAFIGSCTNGRLSDLEEAARLVRGRRVASHVKALVVPGSQAVRRAAEAKGLHEIFTKAGFEWRGAGCSMCLAMNPDKLEGRQVCASSSNRNFKGRQGSPTGRTLLMSPAMVAAAALAGEVVDVRHCWRKSTHKRRGHAERGPVLSSEASS